MNRPIIVKLRSKDVIHSFGVPEFRVKQDAIPGLTIPIWFVPTVTTAEMRTPHGKTRVPVPDCLRAALRLGPRRMRGFVTVQTAEEFQTWLDDDEQGAERAGSVPVSCLRAIALRAARRLSRRALARLVYTRFRIPNGHWPLINGSVMPALHGPISLWPRGLNQVNHV